MSQEEKKQTAPETEAAAEKPETPAQEAPEKEAPQTEEKNEGKHDCKHHHHETAALQAKLEAEEKKNADLKNQLPSMTTTASAPSARLTRSSTTVCPTP